MQEDRRDNSELISQMKDMITPIDNKVERILAAIYGNGNPESSIISHVALNSEFRINTKKKWTSIIGTVVVSLLSAIGSLVLFILHRL